MVKHDVIWADCACCLVRVPHKTVTVQECGGNHLWEDSSKVLAMHCLEAVLRLVLPPQQVKVPAVNVTCGAYRAVTVDMILGERLVGDK